MNFFEGRDMAQILLSVRTTGDCIKLMLFAALQHCRREGLGREGVKGKEMGKRGVREIEV